MYYLLPSNCTYYREDRIVLFYFIFGFQHSQTSTASKSNKKKKKKNRKRKSEIEQKQSDEGSNFPTTGEFSRKIPSRLVRANSKNHLDDSASATQNAVSTDSTRQEKKKNKRKKGSNKRKLEMDETEIVLKRKRSTNVPKKLLHLSNLLQPDSKNENCGDSVESVKLPGRTFRVKLCTESKMNGDTNYLRNSSARSVQGFLVYVPARINTQHASAGTRQPTPGTR